MNASYLNYDYANYVEFIAEWKISNKFLVLIMEKLMALPMNNTNISGQSNINAAVKRSIKPAYWIPLTAAVFFSSYSYAIGLQEIQIKSNLGEPLNATVLLTNPPTSTLNSNCFTVLPKTSNSNFPGITNATARLTKVKAGYAINISSKELVKEPIVSITLASNCNALPIIERTYTMMIDPTGVQEERVAQAIYAPTNNTRVVTSLNSNNSPAIQRAPGASIQQNSSYQIKRGDSLSSIAARVKNIPDNSLWSVATSILSLNPSAFINNNPNQIIQGSTLTIPSFTAEFIPNEKAALSSLTNRTAIQSNSRQTPPRGVIVNPSSTQETASTVIKYTPIQTSNETLSTMTLSTSLSALSLERIEARANGLTVSASLLPNTKNLFGSGEEENPQSPLNTAATSLKQAVEPKIIYVDRPAYPIEIDQRINAGITEGLGKAKSESRFDFGQRLTTILGTLVGLGILSWLFVRPFIKKRNRLAFIRTVRAHKKKAKYIQRNKKRKGALKKIPVKKRTLATEIEEISIPFNKPSKDVVSEKTELELQQHAAEIEAAFTGTNQPKTVNTSENQEVKPDSQVVINKNNGPRESNVAKEIYEVGTIDDTGELVSLTMAFPELEAELNARLGNKIPDLGKDLAPDAAAETMTVQFERPLEDVLDFEVPGLIDNLEGDFEAVVKEGDFASTMVFNEEIFTDDDKKNPFDEAPTLSTEVIGSEDETRLSEIMVDKDGLKASDFGLADEDFPADKEDYRYLEPDASLNTPGINLSTQELEELGFADDDDDNIVPFSKKSKGKKT